MKNSASTLLTNSVPANEIGPVELKASTIKTYRIVYDRCMRKAITKREINPDEPVQITPLDLVEDWLLTVGSCRPQTANTQRSALLWAIAQSHEPGWQEAMNRLNLNKQQSTRSSRSDEALESGRRSRAPGRMIPEADLHILLNRLASRGEWGARSQWFLMAGIASGARPVEWPDADWVDDDKTVLRIYTAKVKARNAWHKVPPLTFTREDLDDEIDELCDADYSRRTEVNTSWENIDFERRMATLDLTPSETDELRSSQFRNGIMLFRDVFIEPQYRTYVRMHRDSVQMVIAEERERLLANSDQAVEDLSTETIYKDCYYNPVRHCIWRACKKVFPNGELYSPVDTRSTFSANRKAQLGLLGASQDLGHQGVTTSRDYYAPASKAWSRYKPQPGQKSVQQLTDTLKPQKVNLKSASDPGSSQNA